MARLDDLMQKPGVIAALTFDTFGNVVDSRGQYTSEMLKGLSFLAAANNWMLTLQGDSLGQLTSLQMTPCLGWVYRGALYSIIIGGNQAVIVATEKADYARLFEEMGDRTIPNQS